MIYTAAKLAAERRDRGLKLNLPQATVLLTSFLLEGARDGRAGTSPAIGTHTADPVARVSQGAPGRVSGTPTLRRRLDQGLAALLR